MRTPILMMLALTVLLGLALGWFTKGVSPVASNAARGPAPSEVIAEEPRPAAEGTADQPRSAAGVAADQPRSAAGVAAVSAAAAVETAEQVEAAATESLRDGDSESVGREEAPGEPAELGADPPAPAESAAPLLPVRPEPVEPSTPDVLATRGPSTTPPVSPPPRSPGEPPTFTADPTLAAIPPDPEAGDLYVVKEGDSLSNIAKRRYGRLRDYRRIYEENRDRIVDPDNIYPGQTLLLPNPR